MVAVLASATVLQARVLRKPTSDADSGADIDQVLGADLASDTVGAARSADSNQGGDDTAPAGVAAADVDALLGPAPASGEDFRQGFNQFAQPKPDLTMQANPQIVDYTAVNAMMASAVGMSIEDTLTAERPKMHTKLKQQAAAAATTATAKATADNSQLAAARGFNATESLVKRKAFQVCMKMSRMGDLPPECAKESQKAFLPTKALSSGAWATAAAKAATADTKAEATSAAYDAVRHYPSEVAPPAGYKAAYPLYLSEMEKYKAQYEKEAKVKLAALVTERDSFWATAQKDIIAKVKAAVIKAVNDVPIKDAERVMATKADAVATKKSAELVAKDLAPKFVAAAQSALETGARAASDKYMSTWSHDWDPPEAEISGDAR